jgi:hypothetical protein
MWNLFMCSLDHCSMYYNCFILHLAPCVGEVCYDLFLWWVHWLFNLFSLPCSFVLDHCSYDLGPKERKRFYVNALVVTYVCFIMVFVSHVDMTFSWMVSTSDVRWAAMMVHIFLIVRLSGLACLEVCLSSFDKTFCSLLQEELETLLEFDACFIALVSGGVWFLPSRNPVF